MRLSAFGLTDVGLMRSRNEDAFLVDHEHRIYAVADGLGGLPGGDVASRMAIDGLQRLLPQMGGKAPDFFRLFAEINRQIFEEGLRLSEDLGIGTTLSLVSVRDHSMTVAHVGDCVVLLLRGGECRQLTRSHTMEQEIRSRMAPGDTTPIPDYFSHTLTRCLGQQDFLEPDVDHHELKHGDRVLLCSDGITKTLDPEELSFLTQESPDPESLARTLIEIANDRGGPDNATVIALFAENHECPPVDHD